MTTNFVQQVNRINVGQMQVVIRLVCSQIGIRMYAMGMAGLLKRRYVIG